MKQSGHWRRSKNHFRRSPIQEPWRLERIQTPIVFKSSRTPNATLSMWPWGGESKVVFNRSFRRTEANLIRAKDILKRAFLSRHEEEAGREATNTFYEEAAYIYFDEAMKTRPKEAWDALLKEILKGDSKSIWHGELMENLSEEERKLILPMMKNYIEKYTPAGDFEKAKARVLVRGDLQKSIGETQGPVCRTESIFIVMSQVSLRTYATMQ